MACMIGLYALVANATAVNYNQNVAIRTFMVACSFVFFENELKNNTANILFCRLYALSLFVQYSHLIILENRFATALYEEHTVGGQNLANSLIFILPLIFYLFRNRLSILIYLTGFVVVTLSLRRTAIITYFLCLPFIYKRISLSFSKKQALFVIVTLCLMVYYIIDRYWSVIEMRFLNLYEANNEGEYGSGRSGWLFLLLKNFFDSPEHWLQGFGIGAVSQSMTNFGYPYGHAHNGYVEILYTYGIIGFFLWFYPFYKLIIYAKKKRVNAEFSPLLYLSSFSFLVVSTMSGTTFLPGLMAIALCVNMILSKKEYNTSKISLSKS